MQFTDIRMLLQFYGAALWQRRWSIVLVAWLVCLVGWGMVANLPDRFEAKARIFVDTSTILGPLMKGLAVSPDVDQQIGMMRRTLLSRPNLKQLVRMTDLDHTTKSDLEMDSLLTHLGQDISLQTDSKDLFWVTYQSTDPQRAYRVVDSILQIFVDQNVGSSQRDVDAARTFIDKQIADYDTKLRDAELKVAQFQREHAEELSGSRLNQQRLDQGEASLRQRRTELDSAIWRRDQLRQQLVSTPRTLPMGEVNVTLLSPAEQRLAELRRSLEESLTVYTDRHPSVVSLRSRIEQVEQEVAKEGGGRGPRSNNNPMYDQLQTEVQTVENAIEYLRHQVEIAQQDLDKFANTASLTPQVEADLKRLTRDYDVLSGQYAQLIQRRESAQLAQRLDTETNRVEFRIVDPPTVPLKPSGPPHGLFMAGVFVVGVGSGFGVALLRLFLSNALSSVGQLRETYGHPVLGSISIVRSALHHHIRLAEGMALGSTAAALLVVFGIVFYEYQLSPHKPDIASLTADLRARLGATLEQI